VAIGGLIVLVLTVALVGPYFVDWTSYRADFEREASRILGRDVEVRGEASARLLPFPSVTFEDVVVAGSRAGETGMAIERFSMDAELAPFLRGEVLIFDMRLTRPQVVVDFDDDGTVDWAARPNAPSGLTQIALENMTITDGMVTLRHSRSGRLHELNDIEATVSARALSGPWRFDGRLNIDGVPAELNLSTGSLDADGSSMRVRVRGQSLEHPVALEADGTVRFEAGRAGYDGQFRISAGSIGGAQPSEQGQQAAAPAYRLSGQYSLDHEALEIPEFRLETGAVEDPYTADGSAYFDLGPEPSFLIRADGAQVRLEEAAGAAGEGLALQGRIEAVSDFLLDLPRPTIPGRLEIRLPAIVAGDTTVRDVHLFAAPGEQGWDISSLGATLPGRTTLEASGVLSVEDEVSFRGDLLLAVSQPSGFATWLARDVDDAIRRLPAAGFSATVELAPRRQVFRDLELILGAARFAGHVDYRQPDNANPVMDVALEGDRLDVEGMSAFASLFVSDRGETRLAGHDVDFDIKAGPVTAFGLEADSVDTALRLREGQLEIDRLSIIGLAGANLSATGTIRDLDGTPTGNLDAAIVATDLAPLVRVLAERDGQTAAWAELARRSAEYPGLLADARLDLVASAAAEEDRVGVSISGSGTAGGSRISAMLSAEDAAVGLAQTPLRFSVEIANDNASPLAALIGLPALPIDFAGAARVEADLQGVLSQGATTGIQLSGDDLRVRFDGLARLTGEGLGLTGPASIEARDLEPWLLTTGVALPGTGEGLPVSLSAELDYAAGLAVLSGLSGSIAGVDTNGDLNVQTIDGLPHITGAISASVLDLGLVAEMIVGQEAMAPGGRVWPTAPFSQRSRTAFTASVDIEAERLLADELGAVSNARLSARLARDGIALSNFAATLHGGQLTGLGELRNDAGTGLFSGQFQVEGARLADILSNDALTGDVDLSATLSASGKSFDGLVAALSGSGTASVRHLGIDGINPDGFGRLIAEADRAGPEIDAAATASFAPAIVRDGTMQIEAVDLAFTVASGVARVPPLRLEAEGASLAAELQANLTAGTIGVDATLTYDPGREHLVGADPAIRFLATGTPADAQLRVDTETLAQFLTQRALELEQARVEAMQARLLEQQRLRREVRYYASLAQERRAEELSRLNAEEEARRFAELQRLFAEQEAERLEEEMRRQAEAEAARMLEQEELRATREAERIAAEERAASEAEARRLAEEEAQREAEQAAAEDRARELEAVRLREENERLRLEVEELIRQAQEQEEAPAPPPSDDPDAVLRLPLPAPESAPLGEDEADTGTSSVAPSTGQNFAPPSLNFEGLPGVQLEGLSNLR
jgi:uncharacterized protein involved in outer membrane biogenesis